MMLTSRFIILSSVLLSYGSGQIMSSFSKNLLCDLSERISKGCSREIATDLKLIQCVFLCGRNDSCIGASLDGNGKCFLHQECLDVRFCMTEDTSHGHYYMSKYCTTPNPSTEFCTKCIHTSCYALTCTELRKRGYTTNGYYQVDPDGPGETTLPAETVYCEMESEAYGVSVIGHDKQARTHVTGFEDPGSYKTVLNYNMSFQQVISLVDHSQNCSQYLQWECHNAIIRLPELELHYTGWLNRSMQLADYLGGASRGSKSCACGVTNTCDSDTVVCNCDLNDLVWREDSGYLTDKDDLPMYGFVAGETGAYSEEGYHTFGELRCWGSE